MSKAGTFPCGRGPAGPDPIVVASAPSPVQLFAAPNYDLATRQILQNADGSFQSVHPVDLAVRLAVGLVLGSIPSAPTVGAAITSVRQDSKSVAEHKSDLTVALAPLVANGDISVENVWVDNSVPSRVIRGVDYINLRLPGSNVQTVSGR